MTNAVVGRDMTVGDLIVFLGETHRIVRFEPYSHPAIGAARIAVCELDWRITVFDDARLEVAV